MSLVSRLKYIQKLSIDNSPILLTAVGVGGVVITGILAFKAGRIVEDEIRREYETNQTGAKKYKVLTSKEAFKLTWKYYIPPVASGAVTIGCLVMASRIGTKRAAALAAAYTISERAFSEYKDKVVDIIGEREEQQVRDEIAQNRIDANPGDGKIVFIGADEVLCFDAFSGRYFKSSMESIRKAQNDINEQIIKEEFASLTDFYHKLGIPATSMSDEVGWSINKTLEVGFSTALTKDSQPCLAMDFTVLPVRDYWKSG